MKRLSVCLATGVLLAASSAGAASFDCSKAREADEKAICASRTLNDLDVRMAVLFDLDASTVAMGARGGMQDEQSAWLKTRNACRANRTCIAARYRIRVRALTDDLTRRMCGKEGPPC